MLPVIQASFVLQKSAQICLIMLQKQGQIGNIEEFLNYERQLLLISK